MSEKTILILGAGLMQKPAFLAAKELGFKTAAVDGNPDALCASLADFFKPVDLKDKDGILAFARELIKSQNLCAIFPLPFHTLPKNSDFRVILMKRRSTQV